MESTTTVTLLRNSIAIEYSSAYFLNESTVKNCTVTLRPIGNDGALSSRPITASRISRSLLSDGSPVEMLFLPIMADILTTEPLSRFPSRASARITTFCPIDTLSTSLSSISALMCREEVSAMLNNGRGVTVLKDSPRLAKTRKTVPSIGARIEHFCISSCLFLLQRRCGKQLRSSNSSLEVGMGDTEITDSLLIRGPGDLLLLIKGALHLLTRLSLFKCRAGGGSLFARDFLLFITCAPQNPGSSLACAI